MSYEIVIAFQIFNWAKDTQLNTDVNFVYLTKSNFCAWGLELQHNNDHN